MSAHVPPQLRASFDWHQRRRVAGIPTVTTLAGPINLGVCLWRGWAHPRPVSAVQTADNLDNLATAWAGDVFSVRSGPDRARAWLARITNRPLAAVVRDTDHATRYDLEQLWRSLPLDPSGPVPRAVFQLIAAHAAGTNLSPVEFVRELSNSDQSAGTLDVFRGLCSFDLGAQSPALLVVPDANPSSGWFVRTFSVLASVATAAPELPIAIAAPRSACETFTTESSSRYATMAREGFVAIEGLSVSELETRLQNAGVVPLPAAATLQRLVADGVTEDGVETLLEAIRAVRNPAPMDNESDFRSVHEKFLFDQLEAIPATAGLFQPNTALPFLHGHAAAEADLLAAKLKLVVEVDGAHYHLTPQQYRRDRRKDILYQQHGYLVLRFLAEDVVEDLETILTTILDAVAFRRATLT